MDGIDEVRLATAGQVVTVDLEGGAGIGSWDIRPVRHAVTAVHASPAGGVPRRPPGRRCAARVRGDERVRGPRRCREAAPASIHDTVLMKETGLAARLAYDPYERRSGLVRFLALDAEPTGWADASVTELGDAVDGAFEVVTLTPGHLVVHRDATVSAGGAPTPVRVTKHLRLGGGRLDPTLELSIELENTGTTRIDARLGIEWTTMMLGGGGNPSAWWDIAGARTGHDSSGRAERIGRLAQGNDWIGLAITTTVTPPAEAWWAPVETISNSEEGFERVYQGSGLLLSWPIALDAGATWSAVIANAVTADRDRATAA